MSKSFASSRAPTAAQQRTKASAAAAIGAILLCLSLSFVVLSRQSRYYALATLLSLAGLWIGARLGTGGRTRVLALVAVQN